MVLSSFFNQQQEVAMNCPSCFSYSIKKNGHIYSGKQNYHCKICGRQFVEEKELPEIDERTRNLLLERLSLRGICRSLGVSLTWLLWFFQKITAEIPEDLAVVKKEKSRITIEIGGMWSFV